MKREIPKLEGYPCADASEVGYYVSDRLRTGSINIYSAYLLAHEQARLDRLDYTKPAYRGIVRLSTLLKLYFDHLTAIVLGCDSEAEEAADWFCEAIPLLKEPRQHFLRDRLETGRALLGDRDFYKLLGKLRANYHRLSDDDGPYPVEVFPYHYAAPELELPSPGSDPAFAAARELDDESSELYVQLQINRKE